MKIPPPLILVAHLAAALALEAYVPDWNILPDGLFLPGVVLVAIGFALAIETVLRFIRNRTTFHPFEKADVLVTTGANAFSRNPIYLGMAAILLGCVFWLKTVPGLGLVVLFILIMNVHVIRGEEKMLAEEFGADYEAYAQRVRRWI